MSKKTAVITGITGQDGAYLAQLLLAEGYRVIGWYPPERPLRPWRLERLELLEQVELEPVNWHDPDQLASQLHKDQPRELYHLGARSSLAESERDPLLTLETDGMAVPRLLEGIRRHRPETRFLLASSAEVFGEAETSPQNEDTPLRPLNIYGCWRAHGQNITAFYRRTFNLFACSVILFNHESPLRDDRFLTQKVVQGFKRLQASPGDPIALGSLDSQRDWGCADEYARGMWLMLQQPQPQDFVLATGVATSVRGFVELCAQEVGFQLEWRQSPDGEEGFDQVTQRVLIKATAEMHRSNDAKTRLGDASRAESVLGWKPSKDVRALVAWMVRS
jgi:GDPmannose 4,6-dehydratase